MNRDSQIIRTGCATIRGGDCEVISGIRAGCNSIDRRSIGHIDVLSITAFYIQGTVTAWFINGIGNAVNRIISRCATANAISERGNRINISS